jgi:ribosome-associated protein
MEDKKMDLIGVTSEVLSKEVTKILLEKLAQDVKMFYVEEVTSVTDYYINATGRSRSQVMALADDVVDLTKERGREVLRVEGKSGGSWILCDFGDVIVNVFDKESREFYNLDRHLPKECEVDISPLVCEVDAKFDINKN